MLVLARRVGEKIYIGDDICIQVVDIDRGKVRLGIDAPREVPVWRQELMTKAIQPGGGGETQEGQAVVDGAAGD